MHIFSDISLRKSRFVSYSIINYEIRKFPEIILRWLTSLEVSAIFVSTIVKLNVLKFRAI